MTLGFFDHLLVLCLVVAVPIESVFSQSRFERKLAEGRPGARQRQYLISAAWQWCFAAVVVALWVWHQRAWQWLGLSATAGWGFLIAAGLSAALTVQLARQARFAQTRPAFAESVRKVAKSLQHMLPTTEEEFRAFTVLCVTAGIVEELVYRGFLIWYFNAALPLWAAVGLSSIVFGLGHAYQGARGIAKTGVVGLAIAGLYLLAGSLWVPMVLHAAVDILQVRMMLNARKSVPVAATV